MEKRIEQHGRMSGRKYETIAILPVRRLRVVAHEFGPEDEGHVGHAHRRAGMSRLRFFHAVDGEEADGVDAKFVELVLLAELRLVAVFGLDDGGCGFGGGGFVHGTSGWDADYTRRNS